MIVADNGSPTLSDSEVLTIQCANAPPAPCDPVQVVDNTYNIFVPEPEPLYWDPTGQYVTPPASMIPHCGERMRAYIMIDKAATRSWETGVPFSTGSFLRSSVSSFQRCQPGWWTPLSTASARIALTRSTVRVRKR